MTSTRRVGADLDIYDSYAALDRVAAVTKDPSSESHKISVEFLQFVDPDRDAPWSHHLLKSVPDVTVFDLPIE